MTKKIDLQVNGSAVFLDYFVQSFIDHTVEGMIESLENTEPISNLDMTVDEDRATIVLNGKPVRANTFVSRIFKTTLFGMVAPLKGVTEPVHQVRVQIQIE